MKRKWKSSTKDFQQSYFILVKNIYVNDYSYTMTQKKQTTVSSFFQIKPIKQGKVTFLTFSLNLIFSKFPHIHKIRTPYFYYFIFMKHFSRLQLPLPMTM